MRVIDPKMSIDTIRSYIEVWDCKGCLPYGGTQHNVMAVDDLLCLPTIEAEPLRHGRWEYRHSDDWIFCTACGADAVCNYDEPLETDYCPNCGARMDGGAENG